MRKMQDHQAKITCFDFASDVGVNLCKVKSCLNTSNNGIFTDKRGDLHCFNISKCTCSVVKSSDEKFVLFYFMLKAWVKF